MKINLSPFYFLYLCGKSRGIKRVFIFIVHQWSTWINAASFLYKQQVIFI